MEPMKPMQPMKPMEPMKPLDFGPAWWPRSLGTPSTTGAQNGMRYAVFADSHRLLIEQGDVCTLYDTADHRIGGASQQSGGSQTLAFTSQHGPVRLDELKKL